MSRSTTRPAACATSARTASAQRPPPAAATRGVSPQDCAIRSERLAALFLWFGCSIAGAQDVDARLNALETQVEALKRRVGVLEGRAPAAAAAAPAPAPTECPGWDRLRISMTEAEVRSLLGAPVKIDATPLQSRWRYPCGTAYFDADTKRFV